MVPLHLIGPNGRHFPVTGIVDSGADCSLFPAEWASPLGIDITACETIGTKTASGAHEAWLWPDGITIRVLDKEIEIPAIFGANDEPLLGRRDFFQHFEITFDQPNNRFFLQAYAS